MSERFLIDVNVAVALLHPRHAHSKAATDWLNEHTSNSSILVCRVVQMGALRLLTKPSVMREDLKSPEEFWSGWDLAMGDERLAFVPEPPHLLEAWRELSISLATGMCVDTDAYLAAFAIAGGYRLATFDKGFARFLGIDLEPIRPF